MPTLRASTSRIGTTSAAVAGKEGLVGEVDLVARDAPLQDLEAHVAREADDGVARDALEAGRELRRVDLAAAHHEEILAAALGHVALVVEQQRLLGTALDSLAQREHGVGVVADRLRLAHRDVHVVARVRGSAHLDAALARLGIHVRRPFPRGDDHVGLQALGAQAHGLGTEVGQRAQVGLLQPVLAHHGAMGLVDRVLVEGHVHAQDVRRAEQAVGVFLQAEDAGAALGGGRHARPRTRPDRSAACASSRACAPRARAPSCRRTRSRRHDRRNSCVVLPGRFTAQQRIPYPHDFIAQRLVLERGHDVVLLLKGESMDHGAISLVGLGEHLRVG